MKNNHASDWQPGTLKTPSEYCRRTFYALSRHFPSTFSIPKQNEYYRGVQKVLARCTSSLDLHMSVVPFWYLFGTLLVPKLLRVCIHSSKPASLNDPVGLSLWEDGGRFKRCFGEGVSQWANHARWPHRHPHSEHRFPAPSSKLFQI